MIGGLSVPLNFTHLTSAAVPATRPTARLTRLFALCLVPGFVAAVADKGEELMGGLGVQKYETKTRGTRTKPAARIAGEGAHD